MTQGVHGHDLLVLAPLRERAYIGSRLRVCEIGSTDYQYGNITATNVTNL